MIDLTKTFLLDITAEQQAKLDPYIQSIKPGEGMIAQVYGDGMRVKKLTAVQARAVSSFLMGGQIPLGESNSAYEAHEMAKKRGFN